MNWLYFILGRFSTDFRKLKILTFAASIQGEGVLAKRKPHSNLGTMQA